MKFPRRQFLHLAAGAAALPAVSRSVWAQAYPTRPVRLIVGYPAGGVADIVARLISHWLSESGRLRCLIGAEGLPAHARVGRQRTIPL
jgi:tripartite-type tricarboxylate transporter receptor subunit TctC